jgi:FkbM family methyltransferase
VVKAFKTINNYYSALGLQGVAVFLLAKFLKRPLSFKKKVSGLSHPIYLRIGTTDNCVFRQIFIEKHYDFSLSSLPNVIIDAGANIGMSAVFFANKYPAAKIIALEPEDSNFALLKENAAPYPQITPLKVALWKEEKAIRLVDPGEGHHGFRTVERATGESSQNSFVPATDLDTLMTKMNIEFIDVLKIDIEGAEKEVFEHAQNWIDRVGVLMVELHDHITPGCTKAFEKATDGFIGDSRRGETLIRRKKVEAMQNVTIRNKR